jgi:ribonuclease BN (tRNA processing enzyme)
VRLQVVGCSPAWPNPGGAHSGYVVASGAGRLLLDCGPGVLTRLREAEGWPTVDAILISHFHLDHWGDLVPWVWGSMFRSGQNGGASSPPIELWVPPGGLSTLRAAGLLLGFEDMFERVFDVRQYTEGAPFRAGGLEVTATRLPHYQLLTFGFRLTDGTHVLAYSGDCAPAPELTELARDADVFLCEATLERGELDGAPRGHLDADEAIAAFRASGAKRLLFTHRPHELPLPEGYEQVRDGFELEL